MKTIPFAVALAYVMCVPVEYANSQAATVNYQGYLYTQSGEPAANGFIAAGTFAPGFDVANYFYVYGDAAGNADDPDHYSKAVADGVFRPIGPGDLTDASGFFQGSGTSAEPAGTPIYLFVPWYQTGFLADVVLATSTHSSYLLPAGAGSTTVDASLANVFIFGRKFNNGLGMNVVPFPEPSSAMLVFISVALFLGARRCRRSLS